MPYIKAVIPILLFVMIAILFSGCTSTRINSIDESNYHDSDGLTSSQKMDAINIAVNDGTVIDIFSSDRDRSNRTIKPVTLSNASKLPGDDREIYDQGFLKMPSSMVTVPIYLEVPGKTPFTLCLNVLVDLSGKRVMGYEQYTFTILPIFNDVLIPSGSTWYHQLSGEKMNNYTGMKISIRAGADDLKALYPIIVDKDELAKLIKDSAYSPFNWVDAVTGETRVIGGNEAMEPQIQDNGIAVWSLTMNVTQASTNAMQYPEPSDYYVVIQNKANKNIPMTLIMLRKIV
jgi:hypothetical protein